MRSLRRTLIAATAGLAFVLGGTPAHADIGIPVQKLQTAADNGVVAGYPGVMGLVVNGEEASYVVKGTRVYGTNTPVDPTAKYRIGSNTKTFVATVVLQLEAEGKLSLDDTVAKWLPGAVNANGYDGNTITIRQLLNHTSGIADYMHAANLNAAYFLGTNLNERYTPQQLVDAGLSQEPPDTRDWKYSNTNYILAGMIIKAVTGKAVSAEVTDRIIVPLRLGGTSFPEYDTNMYGNVMRAWSYVTVGGVQWHYPGEATRSNVELFGPAGAMVSTLEDQFTFERALLSGALLPPAQMAELKTTVPIQSPTNPVPTDNRYGLGIVKIKVDCGGTTQWVWSHAGDVIGYHSRWAASEDGSKVAVIMGNENHLHVDGASPAQQALDQSTFDAVCQMILAG